jgi:hypothetical protein
VAAATDIFVLDLARAAAFGRLPVEARALLRLCDGTRNVDAVCAASDLKPARAQQVLERLQGLGLIRRVNQAVTAQPNQAVAAQANPQPTTQIATQPSAPVATQSSAPLATPPSAPIATPPSAPLATQPSAALATQPSLPLATPASTQTSTQTNPPKPAAAAFTAEEEQFFASSIDHLVDEDFAR